jgi:hypothetical protein
MTADLLERNNSGRLTDPDWEPASTTTTAGVGVVLWTCQRRYQVKRLPFRGGEFVVAIPDVPPGWVLPVVNAIGRLLSLPPNWDSYGAPPVDPKHVDAALKLLADVMRDDTPPPAVVPTSRGGVQIEWHTKGVDLEVELVTPTRLQGICEDHRTGVAWESDLTFDLTPLTDAIAALSRDA